MTCSDCTALREKVEALEWRVRKLIEENELAEQDIAHKRRQIAALKAKNSEREPVHSPEAQDIFDYWVTACQKDPNRTKLTQQRREAIRKALREGYSVEDLQRAAEGLAWDPFVKNGVTYDDITVACRKVEFWRDKADAAQQRREQGRQQQEAAVSDEARRTLLRECGEHASRPGLPALWSGGFENFLRLLEQRGCKVGHAHGNRARAQCPAHDGDNPQSLSIVEADDGRVLAKCFAHDCSWEDICRALGVDSRVFGPREHQRYGIPTDGGKQISFGAAA